MFDFYRYFALSKGGSRTEHESFETLESYKDALSGKSGSAIEMINDTKMFTSYFPIKTLSNTWVVMSIQPYDDAFLPVSTTRNQSFTIILFTLSILSVSAYFVFRITRSNIVLAANLEKLNAELKIQSEKLLEVDKAKEEFSAMITHELKTPLVTVEGYGEMLKKQKLGDLNQDQIDAVNKIYENSMKLENLVTDIMDAHKLDLKQMRFNKEDFLVDEFLQQVIDDHLLLMKEKDIDFVNSSKVKSRLKTDKNRLHQVFSNLIRNAVDFVPRENGRIEIGAKSNENEIIFYVKDNGVGIPADKQESLFKKFYQVDTSAKRKHGGTGLGLTICKGIVEGLEGKIWLESQVGGGANFYFSIPKDIGKYL